MSTVDKEHMSAKKISVGKSVINNHTSTVGKGFPDGFYPDCFKTVGVAYADGLYAGNCGLRRL
jgi:hypothetical protein